MSKEIKKKIANETILFLIYIPEFQTRQACDTQIYKCIFPHVFHLFITIISMLSITLPYVGYSTFSFHLKQVQYATTPFQTWIAWKVK